MPVHSPTRPMGKEFRSVACWCCQQNVREMVYPPWGGSYLGCKCRDCAMAPAVIERVYGEQKSA